MGTFPEWFPPGCPPAAEGVDVVIYHGCESNPPTEEDFTPFAKSKLKRKQSIAKSNPCMASGLSVWVTRQDALHAQELFEYAARWHIFKASVTIKHGKIGRTPTAKDKTHNTFWSFKGVKIMDEFEYALPAKGKKNGS